MHHLHSSVDSGGVYRKSTISVRMASNFPAELPQSRNLSCAGPLPAAAHVVRCIGGTYIYMAGSWAESEADVCERVVVAPFAFRLFKRKVGHQTQHLSIQQNKILMTCVEWRKNVTSSRAYRNELVNRGPPMNCNKVLQFFHEWTHSCKWIIKIINIFTGVIKTHSSVHLCSAYTQPAFCLL